MPKLQRVALLLERNQHEELQKLARQRNLSVSDLVRQYIAAGLQEERNQQRERLLALEQARTLKERIMKRRKGKPLTKSTKVLEKVRQERTNELWGHRS